jgi:hypothetical protein
MRSTVRYPKPKFPAPKNGKNPLIQRFNSGYHGAFPYWNDPEELRECIHTHQNSGVASFTPGKFPHQIDKQFLHSQLGDFR